MRAAKNNIIDYDDDVEFVDVGQEKIEEKKQSRFRPQDHLKEMRDEILDQERNWKESEMKDLQLRMQAKEPFLRSKEERDAMRRFVRELEKDYPEKLIPDYLKPGTLIDTRIRVPYIPQEVEDQLFMEQLSAKTSKTGKRLVDNPSDEEEDEEEEEEEPKPKRRGRRKKTRKYKLMQDELFKGRDRKGKISTAKRKQQELKRWERKKTKIGEKPTEQEKDEFMMDKPRQNRKRAAKQAAGGVGQNGRIKYKGKDTKSYSSQLLGPRIQLKKLDKKRQKGILGIDSTQAEESPYVADRTNERPEPNYGGYQTTEPPDIIDEFNQTKKKKAKKDPVVDKVNQEIRSTVDNNKQNPTGFMRNRQQLVDKLMKKRTKRGHFMQPYVSEEIISGQTDPTYEEEDSTESYKGEPVEYLDFVDVEEIEEVVKRGKKEEMLKYAKAKNFTKRVAGNDKFEVILTDYLPEVYLEQQAVIITGFFEWEFNFLINIVNPAWLICGNSDEQYNQTFGDLLKSTNIDYQKPPHGRKRMIYFWNFTQFEQQLIIDDLVRIRYMGFKPSYYTNVSQNILDTRIPEVTESYYHRMRFLRKGKRIEYKKEQEEMKRFARKHDLEFKPKKNRIPQDLRYPSWLGASGDKKDMSYADLFDLDDWDEEELTDRPKDPYPPAAY